MPKLSDGTSVRILSVPGTTPGTGDPVSESIDKSSDLKKLVTFPLPTYPSTLPSNIHPFIQPSSIHLFIHPAIIHLCIHLPIYHSSIHPPIYTSICLSSSHLSIYFAIIQALFSYVSIHPSSCPPIRVSPYPSVNPFTHPPSIHPSLIQPRVSVFTHYLNPLCSAQCLAPKSSTNICGRNEDRFGSCPRALCSYPFPVLV